MTESDDTKYFPFEGNHSVTGSDAIGLFSFQVKRGIVNEEEIDDEETGELIEQLKKLCAEGKHEEAVRILTPRLSFEFDPSQCDDDPDQYFADTDYFEFECTSENTHVRIGYDDYLVATIEVGFEIPLNEGVSTADLCEYIPECGAWAAASVTPGWYWSGSDGDNVWFLGLKES